MTLVRIILIVLVSAFIAGILTGEIRIGLCCYGDNCSKDLPSCRR